jgi:hypothetical protein
VQYNALTTA